MFWLLVATIGATIFFEEGLRALLLAWKLPEYSHGPLIPVLSLLLFLRQLKEFPETVGPINDRWVGFALLLASVALALVGKLAKIDDVVAYALILWVGAILLTSFGWKVGKYFWPPVVHLVYMLPLPDTLYYKMSIYLQFVSSELGVAFLKILGVSVYLEGNIIDLGAFKLHVAEACSGLNYLFPILSFSYIFAVLYKGPMWHKAILLISAAPITVLMNSVRIAIAGLIVDNFGIEHVEGFSHFFEGWVIFAACILILFVLAWLLVAFRSDDVSLLQALDLETEGLATQANRIRLIQPSAALIAGAIVLIATTFALAVAPERKVASVEREPFAIFPSRLDEWKGGIPLKLPDEIETALQANDYVAVDFTNENTGDTIDFFSAWYKDQTKGGTHSPEICLPGSGWEISELDEIEISEKLGSTGEFHTNRAIIRKGNVRMMVYYWFEQRGRKVANDFDAKLHLLWDSFKTGRTDGAIVRLTTNISPGESDEDAENRLLDFLAKSQTSLAQFIPQE